MTPRIIYYITYLDPATLFLKREEFLTHRARAARVRELTAAGVTNIIQGHFTE